MYSVFTFVGNIIQGWREGRRLLTQNAQSPPAFAVSYGSVLALFVSGMIDSPAEEQETAYNVPWYGWYLPMRVCGEATLSVVLKELCALF